MAVSDKLYTTDDLAKRFSKHPRTIHRWVKSGILEAIQLPDGEYLFKPEFLTAFEERCSTKKRCEAG